MQKSGFLITRLILFSVFLAPKGSSYSGLIEPCREKNRSVQPKKMIKGLKFRNLEVEKLSYLCSENSAEQFHGYREADLHLYFRIIMQKAGFLMTRLNLSSLQLMLCRAMVVKSLPVHHFSSDSIFWSFGIIGFILSNFEKRNSA